MPRTALPPADPIEYDFLVHDEGTLWRFEPLTPWADAFLRGLEVPGWARFGGCVVLDHRAAAHFATQLADEGLSLTAELP